jgi:hypothetical protein
LSTCFILKDKILNLDDIPKNKWHVSDSVIFGNNIIKKKLINKNKKC